MSSSWASSGARRSTLKRTRPGITLRELGNSSIVPTVLRAWGLRSTAMRLTSMTSSLAASSASRRSSMGVGPACASMPCTVTSYQRWPSAAVTTPITRWLFSSTGPCSICASKYAPTAGAGPAWPA